eukprot:TRINITY_DN3221_c0_g1_i1.p3 TRINITY_DN3221_c0_g1~~TRINITY_DN3221_c0_g1_i1.p3  ORF type:complete len:62 (+),score=13.92 TRINITY_DN3221_c0_g1_i1:375-560(+)
MTLTPALAQELARLCDVHFEIMKQFLEREKREQDASSRQTDASGKEAPTGEFKPANAAECF